MATAIPFGWTVQNAAGTAVSGAKIYFYVPNTTTPRTPYSDTGLSVPTANPVVADAAGYFLVYLSSDLAYDIVVKSADDSITYQTRSVASNISGAQPVDPLLTSLAGLTTAEGDFIEATASDVLRVRKLQRQTYAALTAIAAASRHDDMLVYVASRATDGDGGEGWWRFDAGSSATANGGTILAPDAGTGRWIRQYSDVTNAEWFGVLAASADNTAALNAAWAAAAGTGGLLWLPEGTITCTGALVFVGNNVTVRGQGRTATTLYLTRTAGDAMTLGDAGARTVEYAFEDMSLVGVASQVFCRTRFIRGLYIRRCRWSADQFLALGLAADGASKFTYIVHVENCPDAFHLAGGTPTLHHVKAENFAGQWNNLDCFVEGQSTASLHGFYAADNIQQRIDHFLVQGGYWSRFEDNYHFVDARVVNLHIALHLSEGANRSAIRLQVTSSTSKNIANVGWEKCYISGVFSSATSNAIYVRSERSGASTSTLSFGDLIFSSECTVTPLVVWADVGDAIDLVSISSVNVDMTPTNASQYVVDIIGGTSTPTIDNLVIGQITGRAFTNAFAAAVRVTGQIGKVSGPALIAVENATLGFDDGTSTTPVKLTAATMAATDLVGVLDQSTATTRFGTLQALADYLGGIFQGVPRSKSATLQAFRVTVTNTAGTIQHKITAVGDNTNAAQADLIAKITSPSTSLQNTPTGTDSSTAFVGALKISSGDPSELHLDTGNAQTTNIGVPFARIVQNSTGTARDLDVQYVSRNINGVTANRLVFTTRNTTTGATASWNATLIPSGNSIVFDVWAYLL